MFEADNQRAMNDMNDEPIETPGDLDWSAFLYIAGEMTDAQVIAFEQRLGDDQAAREAVATAVEMAQTIDAATAQTSAAPKPQRKLVARRSTHWSSRRKLVYGVMAASVAAVAIFAMVSESTNRRLTIDDDAAIATIWAGSIDEGLSVDFETDADLESWGADDEWQEAGMESTGWLMAAMAYEPGDDPSQQPPEVN